MEMMPDGWGTYGPPDSHDYDGRPSPSSKLSEEELRGGELHNHLERQDAACLSLEGCKRTLETNRCQAGDLSAETANPRLVPWVKFWDAFERATPLSATCRAGSGTAARGR